MTRILLIRHGDTKASQDGRFTGSTDVPLSESGRVHASQLATRLALYPIAAFYSSSMQRAYDTARFIAQVHAMEVTRVPELREIDHGVWDGKSRDDIRRIDPKQIQDYDRDPYHFKPEGGESGEDLLKRAVPAMQALVREHPADTILVVAHKTTNRLLICYFLGIDPVQYREKLAQRPACLNVLEFRNENEAQLLLLNDIGHYAMTPQSDYPYAV
ncbi:MAG TPA: histidine phosphatase family protein [Anaerolineae bacterium]